MPQSTSIDNLNKELQQIFETQISKEEECIGQFAGWARPSFALRLFMGPLSSLMTKYYIVTVTNKKLYFSKKNIWSGKIDITDAFEYTEIEKATIKTGRFLSSLKFKFMNGNTIKLQATYRKQKPENKGTKQIGTGIGPIKFKLTMASNRAILDQNLASYLIERLSCSH